MAFCAKCGGQLADGTNFCAGCGAPVGTAAGGPAAPAPPAPATGLSSNVGALLAYIPFVGFIAGIVFLVIEPYKNDKFVRFHAFQSIFLSVVWIAFHIVWSNVIMGALWSPFSALWAMLGMISGFVSLAFFVCALFLMYKAYNNERFKLPLIGDLAEKQAG